MAPAPDRRVLVLVPVFTFVLCIMFRERFKRFSQRFFAWIYGAYFARRNEKLLHQYKQELFSTLRDLKSSDQSLRERGSIRILEIGIGTGSNLQFYPNGGELITVEPNANFEKYFNENRSKFPNIDVRSICGSAESMPDVATESVDVVVSTLVMCSVDDLPSVIREIKRVLVQGGRLYYLEHERYNPSSWSYTMQRIIDPFWKIFNDGCSVSRNIGEHIEYIGFREIFEKRLQPPELPWPVRPLIYGTAVK